MPLLACGCPPPKRCYCAESSDAAGPAKSEAKRTKQKLDFDMPAFVSRASKVGAKRATIELVTDLLTLTFKALKTGEK